MVTRAQLKGFALAVATVLCIGAAGAGPAGASTPPPPAIKVNPTQLPSAGGPVAVLLAGIGTGCQVTSSYPAVFQLKVAANCRSATAWVSASGIADNTPVTFTVETTKNGVVTSASATVNLPGSTSPTYVAVGDSFASGEGNRASGWVDNAGVVTKAPSTRNGRGCHRSSLAYPVLVASALQGMQGYAGSDFNFYACSGDTTTDVSTSSSAASVGLKGANVGGGEPAQVESNPSSLNRARIVTVTIGGNDIGFSNVMYTCWRHHDQCNANSNDPWTASLIPNIAKLQSVLTQSYATIRAAAPNAKLLVLDYPDLIPQQPTQEQLTSGCMGLKGDTLPYLAQAEIALHAAIRQAASDAGAIYVNPNDDATSWSFSSHTLCAKTGRWFNGASVTASSFHPNSAGQGALAQAVAAAVPPPPPNMGVCATPNAAPTGARVLVFGGDAVDYTDQYAAPSLQNCLALFGYQADLSTSLPHDLTPYKAVFFVNAYHPLTADEQNQLVAFEQGGGGLFLSGEWYECCSPQNQSIQDLLNSLLGAGAPDLTAPVFSEGESQVNPNVVGNLASYPNELTTLFGAALGSIVTVGPENVFFTGNNDPTAAAWLGTQTANGSGGNIVVLMDTNWLQSGYSDPATAPAIVQNIAYFIAGAPN